MTNEDKARIDAIKAELAMDDEETADTIANAWRMTEVMDAIAETVDADRETARYRFGGFLVTCDAEDAAWQAVEWDDEWEEWDEWPEPIAEGNGIESLQAWIESQRHPEPTQGRGDRS